MQGGRKETERQEQDTGESGRLRGSGSLGDKRSELFIVAARRAATRDRDPLRHCLHLDQRLLQQLNAKKPSGTKNYYAQLAQIADKIEQRWKKLS